MGINFRSDNETGAAPEIMAALVEANAGTAHSYGDDDITARLKNRFREVFETELEVYSVISGTAANALAVAQTTPAYGAVICHEDSHLNTDECGAPEFFSGGAKLLTIGGAFAKLDAEAVGREIARIGQSGDHGSRHSLLSFTQATEFGAVYSLDESVHLCEMARTGGLKVHMDGARLGNALCSLGCSPADMTWRAGVDLVSFGATKNGAMMAEALLIFDSADAVELGRRRKQAGHLISKMRYVSAQLDAYLSDDLWLKLAGHANEMAAHLVAGLKDVDGIELLYPVQANEIFLHMSDEFASAMHEADIEFHCWPKPGVYRLVTAHCTRAEEVDAFLAAARSISDRLHAGRVAG